jgi:hypothetical protein
MTGPVLWRISEVPLTTFDSCLWLQNGLWQAIRAVFMSSHDNCKYTIGYPLTGLRSGWHAPCGFDGCRSLIAGDEMAREVETALCEHGRTVD